MKTQSFKISTFYIQFNLTRFSKKIESRKRIAYSQEKRAYVDPSVKHNYKSIFSF